jgi:hypothetical protein
MASFALFRRPTSSHSPSCVPPSLRSACFKPVFLSPSANSPTAGTIRSVRLSRSGHNLVLSTNLLAQLKFKPNISPFTLISSVELRFISCAVYLLRYLYCAISFNSARVVTQNTDSALRQPTKFGVTLPKIRHTRRKFFLFCTSEGDLALMSRILHSALGAVTRDQDQNSSRHRECVMRNRRIE